LEVIALTLHPGGEKGDVKAKTRGIKCSSARKDKGTGLVRLLSRCYRSSKRNRIERKGRGGIQEKGKNLKDPAQEPQNRMARGMKERVMTWGASARTMSREQACQGEGEESPYLDS